ncbi:MAG: TonB-dependent receptor [Gammaproteobacteria bacterium]|nr:TonB-dependent receptor [Gammaproteobacteria bacterium]
MFSTTKLQSAVSLGLGLGVIALAVGYSPGAIAQGAEPEQIEEIITTGSRIIRKELTDAQPIQVLDAGAIEATGLNNLGDILMNITSSDGTGLRPITTATNGSDGTQQISLRNLGADRTLILVDGRRWVTDIDQTVDLNTIPLAMVERIEVLKDGASAIYGSDAIAGVINVITKSDFDGITLDLQYGETAKGDGANQTISLTMGTSDEDSSAVLSVSFTSQDEILAGDRKISNVPVFGCREPWQSFLCGSSFPAWGRNFTLGNTTIPGTAGTDPINHFEPWSNAARYNFAPVNYLQQPIDRYNIFGKVTRNLTDTTEIYGKLTYVKRTSVQQLAQVPLTIGVSGPQWNWRPGANITADNVFNPFDEDIGGYGLRMIAVGPRQPNYDFDTYGINLGVKGEFEAADRAFNWDVGVQRNDGQYDSVNYNYINLFNLANALGPSYRDESGTLRCGDEASGEVLRGCTPFNMFAGPDLGVAAGVITPEEQARMIDYISYTQVNGAGNRTENYYADLSGELFELPGGMAAFAVGFEYRSDNGFSQPDALVAGGGSSDNFSEPTKGRTKSEDVYLEISLPLLADVAGAENLELNLAVRNTDYEGAGLVGGVSTIADVGSNTSVRAGILWRPIEDLMIRANWGETFRAPSVSDLYGGGGESFPTANDPCATGGWDLLDADEQARCIAQGVPDGGAEQPTSQLRTLVGGNPNLQSEEGENMTVGFVYTPSFVEGLDIILDYWQVELEQAQSFRGAQTILNNCILLNDPGFCSFIERQADGGIETVRTTTFNAAARDVEGVDVGFRYALSTDNMGDFRFSWDSTYTRHDKTKSSAESDWSDDVGIYQGATNWEWRTMVTTDWVYGDWAATWTMRYMSELEEDCWIHYYGIGDIDPDSPTYDPIMCSNPTEEPNIFDDVGVNYLDATLYHDVRVVYTAPWDGIISVGARNLFGEEPPLTQNSFAHSFDGAYDLPGGAYWFASYRHNFD